MKTVTICLACRLKGYDRILTRLTMMRQQELGAGRLAGAEALEAAIGAIVRLEVDCPDCRKPHTWTKFSRWLEEQKRKEAEAKTVQRGNGGA